MRSWSLELCGWCIQMHTDFFAYSMSIKLATVIVLSFPYWVQDVDVFSIYLFILFVDLIARMECIRFVQQCGQSIEGGY